MPSLDSKNLSPRILSVLAALILSLMNTLLSLILGQGWIILALVFLITFLAVYGLFYYMLQRFIYRKIKLIYKFIYQTKATKREEFFNNNILPQKSLEQVSEDVQDWAAQRSQEIELLRANEEFRREFLMNLAHELRTPLCTVQGYIDTLLAGAIEDPAVRLRFLKNASRGTERLVQLLDDLNEISSLESGRMPLVQESFIIQDLITDVFDEFTLDAAAKNMKLGLKKGTGDPIAVFADKQKIRQVLVNLVKNATKYGNESGTITAGCYIMDDRRVYVEISDDGPGIAAEHLPRLFERFYRADRSRNREIGGTGLGLAIVKHIIEAHGQTINVRSKPGVGSSFGFTLQRGKD